MSGSISKSDQVLLDSARDLEVTYYDVIGDVRTMRMQLDNLQHEWLGRGGAAFQEVITRWQREADEVLRALWAFKDELEDAEATYDATEQDVACAFTKYSALS